MKRERKRNGFLMMSAVIGLGLLSVLAILGLAVVGKTAAERKSALESGYRRAFYDMCDSANNLEINLSKLMVATAKRESLALVNDTTAQAELAENSLSALPIDYGEVIKTSKYLNQVSDWSRSYASAIVGGADCEQFANQAEQLYIVARSLNGNLKELASKTEGKCISDCVGENRLLTLDFAGAMSEIEHNGIEYPELIYDGPFSDAKTHCWKGIDGKEEVDEGAALNKVKEVLGVENAEIVGVTDGKAKIYEIRGTLGGETVSAAVTVKGGILTEYNRYKKVMGVTLSDIQAREIALGKITQLGYENMRAVWYNAERGIAYINLVPVISDVVIYTDLVKVKLALDDGSLLGIEASGYCAGHATTTLTPTIDEDTARSLVSAKIAVEKVTLAVIPDEDAEKDYLCYEFFGNYKGLDYFVYIDAYDGTQRDVLRVIDDSQGEMIM